MKKKISVTNQDIETWNRFIKNPGKLEDKDFQNQERDIQRKIQILDLHSLSLDEANKKVLNFIEYNYEKGSKKLKVITGKGSRSKNLQDPYVSKSLSILKNSVPDFIKTHSIYKKIEKITIAEKKDGGEGAFYIFLKKNF